MQKGEDFSPYFSSVRENGPQQLSVFPQKEQDQQNFHLKFSSAQYSSEQHHLTPQRINITETASKLGETNHNFLLNLGSIDEELRHSRKFNKKKPLKLSSQIVKSSRLLDSDYRLIPNNFKTHEGVAFAVTRSKINFEAGLSGIYNMGNTCFFSTSIQCLSAVQPLTDFFIGGLHLECLNKTNPMGSGGNVTLKFANLIKSMWTEKKDKIYPSELHNTLEQYAKHLICGQQQDAQEFLAYLLDILHEDLNRADKLKQIQQAKSKHSASQQADDNQCEPQNLTEDDQEIKAYEAWRDHLQNNRSIIVDLFQGQLKSTLKCLVCNYVSIKFDSFMYLSVPIPQHTTHRPTLEQCVQEFTKEEILDGEDKWKCLKCKVHQRSSKKIDIWKLPSILIVSLKRFQFSQTRMGKIKDPVEFPLKNLDLTPNVSRLQRDKPIYDLFAVMNHDGQLNGGHYFSYTKHRHNQQWYYFNDEVVRQVKKEEQIVSADAYILFYSKMSVDDFCRQTLSEPQLWPHMIQNQTTSVATNNKVDVSKILMQNTFDDLEDNLRKSATFQQLENLSTFSRQGNNSNHPSTLKPYEQQHSTPSRNDFITPQKKALDYHNHQASSLLPYENRLSTFKRDNSIFTDYQPQFTSTPDYQLSNKLTIHNLPTQQQQYQHKSIFSQTAAQNTIGPARIGTQSTGNLNDNLHKLNSVNEARAAQSQLFDKKQQQEPYVINNNHNNYTINLFMRKPHDDPHPNY